MKGQTEMLSFFIKIMEIGFTCVGIFAVFISVMTLSTDFKENQAARYKLIVGEAALSADCLAVMKNGVPIKGVFDESKLAEEGKTNKNPSCLPLDKDILLHITSGKSIYTIGDPNAEIEVIKKALGDEIKWRKIEKALKVAGVTEIGIKTLNEVLKDEIKWKIMALALTSMGLSEPEVDIIKEELLRIIEILVEKKVEFPAAVKLKNGEVNPALLAVFVGDRI